jgi:hypothetical protein
MEKREVRIMLDYSILLVVLAVITLCAAFYYNNRSGRGSH